MDISFLGVTREVTGSCCLLHAGGLQILVDCSLIQGGAEHERHNREPFPFEPADIDAVVLTHAHLDHSGRLPLLVKQGFGGPIFRHRATVDSCAIKLADAAHLNESQAERENRRRTKDKEPQAEPLYTSSDARQTQEWFVPVEYGSSTEIGRGAWLTLRDAGHILSSAAVELDLGEGQRRRRIVFSGDLGHRGAPILRDPEPIERADPVVMESTYGERLHCPWQDTWQEMGDIPGSAKSGKGNILVPAFTIGRTQELLNVVSQHFDAWGLADWQIFLDSPMAIEATEVYARHAKVYDQRARQWHADANTSRHLPNRTNQLRGRGMRVEKGSCAQRFGTMAPGAGRPWSRRPGSPSRNGRRGRSAWAQAQEEPLMSEQPGTPDRHRSPMPP